MSFPFCVAARQSRLLKFSGNGLRREARDVAALDPEAQTEVVWRHYILRLLFVAWSIDVADNNSHIYLAVSLGLGSIRFHFLGLCWPGLQDQHGLIMMSR
jgi:hypothetical protein